VVEAAPPFLAGCCFQLAVVGKRYAELDDIEATIAERFCSHPSAGSAGCVSY
jgi:hypothetical protein